MSFNLPKCAREYLCVLLILLPFSVQGSETLDFSFLRSPPYERQKLTVDLASIKNKSDLQPIKEAIDDIIAFIYSTRESSGQTADRFTERGSANFVSEPKIMDANQREKTLIPLRQYDWEVTQEQEIILTSDYGFTAKRPRFSQRMVFKKVAGRWRFDRYEWRREK